MAQSGQEILDWCEIGLEHCRKKKEAGQQLKNAAGLIVKLVKDTETRERIVGRDGAESWIQRFRRREETWLRQEAETEQRNLIGEYERFRDQVARKALDDLSEERRRALRRDKAALLKQQDRFDRLAPEARDREVDELILRDLAVTLDSLRRR